MLLIFSSNVPKFCNIFLFLIPNEKTNDTIHKKVGLYQTL